MPETRYVVQMSKQGGDPYQILDKTARAGVSAEVTAREAAIAAEAAAREAADEAEATARAAAIAQEVEDRTAAIAEEAEAREADITAEQGARNSAIEAEAAARAADVKWVTDGMANSGIELAVWERGYYDLSGTSVDIETRVDSGSYKSAVMACEEGDVFIITSVAASTARNWAMLNAASGSGNIQLKKYSPFTSEGEIVVVQIGAEYMVFNAQISSPYSVTKVNLLKQLPTLGFDYADKIYSNSDLNDYKDPGNYNIATYAIAQTIAHIPEAVNGRLLVLTTSGPGSVLQIFITNTGRIYTRTFSNSEWTEWQTLITFQQLNRYHSLLYSYGDNIAAGEDLNDYNTVGNYYISTSAAAKAIDNTPVALGGRLIVMTLAGQSSLHHWYIDTNGDWHVREKIAGVWGGWKHFATSDDISDAVNNGLAGRSAYNSINALRKQAEYDIAFANAFVPLPLNNYLGNTQNVHPKVLYFENAFGGHKWWMAYTPYPYSNDAYENPCVAYSDDGIRWTNIEGNPLSDPQGNGYNSDPHLVYRSDTGVMECWYRYVGPATQDPREETIYRRTTLDGVTWTAQEMIYTNVSGNYAQLMSPAVEFDGTDYQIWVVASDSPMRIDYYTAPKNNVRSWTKVRSFNLRFDDDDVTVYPWHIDVIRDGTGYIMLVMCRNSTSIETAKCSLFAATSQDNITYATPFKAVGGADSWDKYMYRSSIVKIGTNRYRIYYSAGSGGTQTIYNRAVWGIGITEGDETLASFYGLYE